MPRLAVAWALPDKDDTLIRLSELVLVGMLPWLSSFQPSRYRPAAFLRSPFSSGLKLPARVYSCVAVALALLATTKKPLPEMDRSVGEDVEVGRPWVMTSWPIRALTPEEELPARPGMFRKVWKLTVWFL